MEAKELDPRLGAQFGTKSMAEAFENHYYEWYLKKVAPLMLIFGGVLCVLSALYMIVGLDASYKGASAGYLALIVGLSGALLLIVYFYLRSLIGEYRNSGRRTGADFFASGLIVVYSIVIATAPQMPVRSVIFVFGLLSLLLVPRLKPWRLLIAAIISSVAFVLATYGMGADSKQVIFSAIDATAATVLTYLISRLIYVNRVEAFAFRFKQEVSKTAVRSESEIDPLTGLLSKRRTNALLEHEWARTKRNKGTISLVLVDIDQLKSFSDRYGHAMGDECIRAVAEVLKSAVRRGSDVITRCTNEPGSRYCGDEFLLLLPDTTPEGAEAIAQSIMDGVRKSDMLCGKTRDGDCVSVSIGVATAKPAEDDKIEGLLERAESALQFAKDAGRNQFKSGD